MNLVGSMITRNELGRYLEHSIAALLGFCDEVRVLDDGSTDGTLEYLASLDRVAVKRRDDLAAMFEHEGRGRNDLLDWTLAGAPSHVITVDADEIVIGGAQVRQACVDDGGRGVWTLVMEEVWKADRRGLWTREDGGWRRHPVPIVWRAPAGDGGAGWRVRDRQLACGREPLAVQRVAPKHLPAAVLHFGWSNEAERQARYDRYVVADGGRFHAGTHLASILDADSKVRLRRRYWPAGIDADALLARVRCDDCATAVAA